MVFAQVEIDAMEVDSGVARIGMGYIGLRILQVGIFGFKGDARKVINYASAYFNSLSIFCC